MPTKEANTARAMPGAEAKPGPRRRQLAGCGGAPNARARRNTRPGRARRRAKTNLTAALPPRDSAKQSLLV